MDLKKLYIWWDIEDKDHTEFVKQFFTTDNPKQVPDDRDCPDDFDAFESMLRQHFTVDELELRAAENLHLLKAKDQVTLAHLKMRLVNVLTPYGVRFKGDVNSPLTHD